jgi:ribonuclease J
MNSPVYEPRPLAPATLRVIPIGGLGEIGRNMTSYEIDGKILIVDCGVLFPEENQPGVDLILPDFSPIRDRLDDVLGVVLTHGHEDHIGAVPYLLKLRQDIPLIGSTLTLALIEAKLKEHAHRRRGPVREDRPVRPRVHRGESLDSGCPGRRDQDRRRGRAAHR